MERWNPQLFRNRAVGVAPEVLDHMVAVGRRITSSRRDVQPVFTLKHLAVLSGVDYGFLRNTVARNTQAYTEFQIRKRPGPNGQTHYRSICVPSPALMKVQRWINRNILAHVPAHPCSVAFSPRNSLYDAVAPHCPAKWLVKLDIRHFFESILESSVYEVFSRLGYEPLVAFELSRLCTHVFAESAHGADRSIRPRPADKQVIAAYQFPLQGHLPQGAPTSPMLANLVCEPLDERLAAVAEQHLMRYTRYADDMTFSTGDVAFGRSRAQKLVQLAYEQLARQGLSPNRTKTNIVSPGARKLVLGLSVEEDAPRLTRHFKDLLRQHVHYLLHKQVGPVRHAVVREFASTTGMRHYLEGLLGFAAQIEPAWAAVQRRRLQAVDWPN